MNKVIKLTFVLLAITSLGACGFKSELMVPEGKKSVDDLFVPDNQLPDQQPELASPSTVSFDELPQLPEAELPDAQLADEPAYLPDDGEVVEFSTEDPTIELVTTQASDGDILIDPDADKPAGDTSAGVSVDLSDLVKQIEDDL